MGTSPRQTRTTPGSAEPSARDRASGPELTLVAPVRNELANLAPLVEEVRAALDGVCRWELVLVDDGSDDGSAAEIRGLARTDRRVRGVYLTAARGQTSAIVAGAAAGRAPLLATIDADLQLDPADLVPMLADLGEADAVVGWRRSRSDRWAKRLASALGNAACALAVGERVRDTACPLKLLRAEALAELPLFEGMHRYLPTLLRWHGFRVVERPVSHRERRHGTSKYGLGKRWWPTVGDLLALRLIRSRAIHRGRGRTTGVRRTSTPKVARGTEDEPREARWPGATDAVAPGRR